MTPVPAMTRRTFGQLAGITAATVATGAFASPAFAGSPQDPPVLEETGTEVVVDNGLVRMVIDRANGRMTSLIYDGVEMVGRGNYDMNAGREGGALPLPGAENGIFVRREQDFVDVAFRHAPSSGMPCYLVRHHIMRAGEPGIHLAYSYDHPKDFHGFRIDQHRYVFYMAGDTFTHASVPDDAHATPWREAAAQMPTPAEMKAGRTVMDATTDLEGTGTAYPRRYYTKYDWAVYMKDHHLHGLYGSGYGIWAALPSLEAFSGGPVRQDLVLHQRDAGPVLLVEPHATHYGTRPVRVAAGQAWQKTYGPYFVYFNKGTDGRALRRDADKQARPAAHADFYDRLAIEGWTPKRQRSRVRGKVRLPGVSPKDLVGAVVVLSDNRTPMQDTVLGYNYWSEVENGGHFSIDGVRAGTYRLTIYGDGIWGEHVIDDVAIQAGSDVRLGKMIWEPERHGETIFQIGSPTRDSREFRNGRDFRQYGLFHTYRDQFPDGVTYVVGESSDEDWNYLHYQRSYEVSAPEGSVVPEDAEGVRLFDFGSSSSPVADGYERVARDTLYSAGGGFGLDRATDFRDRGEDGDLRRDFVVGGCTFSVDLPDGEYDVTVISGDAIAGNKTTITIGEAEPVNLQSGTGEYATHTARVVVSGGRLDVVASGDGRINAIEIVATDAAVPVLESLSVDGAELVPGFSSFRSDFAVDFPHDRDTVRVLATARGGSRVEIDGVSVSAGGLDVAVSGPHTVLEIRVVSPEGDQSTYRLHVTRQEKPWRILFDVDTPVAAGAQATLSVWLAAWAMGSALPVPPEQSNLTIRVNGEPFVWTFEPDDARGATYRSGRGGRTFHREFTFDAALLKPEGNVITLQINDGAEHLWNEAAYDAIRLEIAS
ncbi:polysaccharide lyase family protein [Microbacterium sp. NPDC058345]|uniref:polysaccharide lyase family protein n=1 Tax=Microbacterium sp. NPDC058345 TaxID=3346455 RepID=UPI00365EC74A